MGASVGRGVNVGRGVMVGLGVNVGLGVVSRSIRLGVFVGGRGMGVGGTAVGVPVGGGIDVGTGVAGTGVGGTGALLAALALLLALSARASPLQPPAPSWT